jgi:hypothetical protein
MIPKGYILNVLVADKKCFTCYQFHIAHTTDPVLIAY